ncbi:MAG: CapA family protein [Thermoleophilia bacterium]|nr:CapA family protein [Thermoleophilia bacterium]
MKVRSLPTIIVTVLLLLALCAVAPAQSIGSSDASAVAPATFATDTAPLGADPAIELTYLRGDNRYDTAIKISKAMFPEPLPAGSGVVVAPGETYQEALCGAPLAAAWGGPALLTYQAALANNVKAELERLAPENVICIGMAPEVLSAVQAALPTSTVTAINGSGAAPDVVYDMSYQVAKALGERVNATGGDISASTAIVTIGSKFPDAIGVSPLACAQKWPVLLTDQADDSALHPSAAAALAELNIIRALKVGTYATLPDTVQGVGNLSGTDRYYTNCNVATWAQAYAGLSFTHTGLATGDKFPDALAAGPYLGRDGGLLLLTPVAGPIPAGVAATLQDNASAVQHLSFIAMIEIVLRQGRSLVGLPAEPPFPPANETWLTVAAGGDVLGDRNVGLYIDAHGGEAVFAGVTEFLEPAHLAFVNLEGPISNTGTRLPWKDFTFRARPALTAGLLSAGIDVVSLANNHTMDYTSVALLDCISRLNAAGIGHAGAGANAAAACQPAYVDTPAGTVAVLAYSRIVPSGFAATSTTPGIATAKDWEYSTVLAQVAAASAASDFCIVSFHWGVEYDASANWAERDLAHRVVDAGADLVLGHHPHVIQGLEVYKNKLIAYSLGDFVFDHYSRATGEAFVLQVVMSESGAPRGEIIPVYLDDVYGIPSPVHGWEADAILDRLTSLSAALGVTLTKWDDRAFFGYP